MKTRSLAYDAARARALYPALPARLIAVGSVVTLLGAWTGAPFTRNALLATLIVFVPTTLYWLVREVLPAQGTRGIVERKGDRRQRAGGVASVWDVMERASGATLRRQVKILRPSLKAARRRNRRPADFGVLVARTGFGLRWGQQLWSSCRDHTLRVGAPGTGKTLSLAVHGLDAPGAVITTSTRFDLACNIHIVRRAWPIDWQLSLWRRVGRTLFRRILVPVGQERAVHIYNPTGHGDVPSTVRWNILKGCTDYSTAQRRAGDLIPENRSADREAWDSMARRFLPIFLYAAAVGERSVRDVLRWVETMGVEDKDDSVLPAIRREISDILASKDHSEHVIDVLRAFMSMPYRTRGSVTGMMIPALGWIAEPIAYEIGAAPLGTTTIDIRELILKGETLHIVGPSQLGSSIAPLTSAFIAEIAEQARQLAATMPGERLDPPLTMLLDECAVTVRLPLDHWTADMGGRGITLHMSVQSLSQLEQTWGVAGAGTLKGNIGSLILFGGGKDADEMQEVSALCGDRWRRVITKDTKVLAKIAGVQRGEWDKVPVLSASDLTNMPPGQVAVLMRNLGGVFIGHAPAVIERRGWKALLLDAPMPAPRINRYAKAPVIAEPVETVPVEELQESERLA